MPYSRSKFNAHFLGRPIAHRALHKAAQGVIENSLEAVNAALNAKLPIEIDLQNTKDARAVVFHDEKLSRLCRVSGRVQDKTLAEMEALPLLGGGTTIGYQALLEHIHGQIPILVEIKDQSGRLGETLGSFLPDIIAATKSYKGAIALMSFNPYIVQALRQALPNHALGLTTCDFAFKDWPQIPSSRRKLLRERLEIPTLDYDFISHDHNDLTRVRELEKPILCWTVKSKAQEIKAREIADNITFEGYKAEHNEA